MGLIEDNSAIVVVDVAGFTNPHRTNSDYSAIRRALYRALESAFEFAGIPWNECRREDRGDGVLIVVPKKTRQSLLVSTLPARIAHELTEHNTTHPPETQIRLRMAVHAGEVFLDEHGPSGSGVILPFRLLDSRKLREALATSSGALALITSSSFYHDVVARSPISRPETFRKVRVSVKETATEAWICLPGSPRSDLPVGGAEPDHIMISYAAPDQGAVRALLAQSLREAGYDVWLDEWEYSPGQNFASLLNDALHRADQVITVLSPAFARVTSMMSESSANLGDRVIPVRVEATSGPLPSGTIDLVGLDEETARQRLLAGVTDRGDATSPESSRSHGGVPMLIVHSMPDLSFAAELHEALRGLTAEGVLSSVDLRAVGEVDEETTKIVDRRVLRTPGVVLLLVSRDLLAAGYGASQEARRLLRRHEDRRIIVRPVVVKPTSWEKQLFGRLAALPAGGRPVSQWTSRDDAVKNIVDGVRLAVRELTDAGTKPPVARAEQPAQELGDVFKKAGFPTATFVEPDDFVEFKMALRHPGLGVVLEGPSGIGKTTQLRHAVKQDAGRLGTVPILSARRPSDIPKIRQLLEGHTGLIAVDDFQRLPGDLQHQLGDYLKLLADDDGANAKLIIVGIPGTAQSLVDLASDVATRIQVFRLGKVADTLLLQMIEKGESALNITFDRKTDIAIASAGSLATAQMLCWQLAMTAGIEQTVDEAIVIRTDIDRARGKVTETLRMKYQQVVDDFIVMDNPTEPLCIDLLLALAEQPDGVLRLTSVVEDQPHLRNALDRVFLKDLPHGLIADHLYYDPRGHRLVVDDPQFVFYLRQLSRAELLDIAGKRLPTPRDQIFLCYSRKDTEWLDRVQVHLRPLERAGVIDLWSDRRIEAGDMWRKELAAALARARVALLMVSADFFASDFIHSEELPPLLAAAEEGGCRVIPLLVRPSIFSRVPELSRFNSMPSGTTLSELSPESAERVLADLATSFLS